MVISTDATFKAQKSSETNKPIYLYTIEDYDSNNTNLYFTDYDEDVTYDGQTYTAFPIAHESVEENRNGRIDTVRVNIANISRLIQSYLELYDLRNKKVSIKHVWADELDDTDAYIEYIYYIDSYGADQMNATFLLASKIDTLDVMIPARLYSRNYCSWKFSGTECGYSGVETTCNKTKIRCKQLNNYQRFGGFPSVPTRRLFAG